MDVRHNNNALKELNDCIGDLLHLGSNVITFRTLLHLAFSTFEGRLFSLLRPLFLGKGGRGEGVSRCVALTDA